MFYFFNANYYIHHKLKKTYIYIFIDIFEFMEDKDMEKNPAPQQVQPGRKPAL